jgi:hypothetical protein
MEISLVDWGITGVISEIMASNLVLDSPFPVNWFQGWLYGMKRHATTHDRHKLIQTQDLSLVSEENSSHHKFSRENLNRYRHR